MIRRPPRSTRVRSSAASDVYKRQDLVRGAKAIQCGRRGVLGGPEVEDAHLQHLVVWGCSQIVNNLQFCVVPLHFRSERPVRPFDVGRAFAADHDADVNAGVSQLAYCEHEATYDLGLHAVGADLLALADYVGPVLSDEDKFVGNLTEALEQVAVSYTHLRA